MENITDINWKEFSACMDFKIILTKYMNLEDRDKYRWVAKHITAQSNILSYI